MLKKTLYKNENCIEKLASAGDSNIEAKLKQRRSEETLLHFIRLILKTRAAAARRYFPSTVDQKWLKNDVAENFDKDMGTQGCDEVCF